MFQTVKAQDWALKWTTNSLDELADGRKGLLIWWVHNWDFRKIMNMMSFGLKRKMTIPMFMKTKFTSHHLWWYVSVHGIDNSARAPLLQKGAYRNDIRVYSSREMTPGDFRINDCSQYTRPSTLRIHRALLNGNMITETSNCSAEYRNQATNGYIFICRI